MTTLTKAYTPPAPPISPQPPVAPTPEWTEKISRTERVCYDPILYEIIDPVTGEGIGYGIAPGFCEIKTVVKEIVHPATPGSPGAPGHSAVPADYMLGWNAGATSALPMTGNGQFEFQVPTTSEGIVCGLATEQLTIVWGDFPWAFKVSAGQVHVVELGATKAGPFSSPEGTPLVIARAGPQIRYVVNGEIVYTSSVEVDAGVTELWACSSLYRGLDVIVDAAFEPLSVDFAGVESDSFDGVLGQLLGWFSEDGAASLNGVLGQLRGELNGESNVLTGVLGQLKSSMGGGGLSAILEGELSQLIGTFETGLLAPAVGSLEGYLSGVAGFFIGLPGGKGELAGTLGQLEGFLTNVGFAVMQGTLGGLVGRFATPQWLRPQRFVGVGDMQCGLVVKRVPRMLFEGVGSMSAALETEKTLAGTIVTVSSMAASLRVVRTFEGVMSGVGTLACSLPVVRTLRPDEIRTTAAMACALQLTRVLRAAMAGVGTMQLEGDDGLHVTREVPALAGEEITVTLDDGSVTEGADDDHTDVEVA